MSFTLKSNIPKLIDSVRSKAISLVDETALEIEVAAKTSMTEPKSGRVYGTHQASAPGEAPAIDSSELAKSFAIEATGETLRAVGVTDKKGTWLELGTSQIAPRPFLEPASESVKDNFEKGLKELIK